MPHGKFEDEYSFYDLFRPLTTKKAIIFIISMGFFVFFNALFNGFVWDDLPYIILNPETHTVNLARAFGENVYNGNGYYRPLQPLYFASVYTLFRETAFFYHLLQISLHIISAILVFHLFKKFLAIPIAFVLAVIFLIHPMQVESVAYIAASGFQIFFICGMLALLMSLKKHINKKDSVFIGLLLLLSLLTRETAILFFILIPLFQLLYGRKRILLLISINVVVVGIYSFIRFGIFHSMLERNSHYPIAQLGFWERLISIPNIIYYYIKTLIFPSELAINQHWTVTTHNLTTFYIPLVIDIFVLSAWLYGGYYLYTKKRSDFTIFLVFSLWIFFGFAMLMQIVPLDMTVAERWVYFPLVGILGVLGVLYQRTKIKSDRLKKLSIFLLVALIVFFSIRTMVRNANWYSPLTLFSHDITVEQNYDLENMLGTELARQNRDQEALPHLLNAHKMSLQDSNVMNIGLVYEKLGHIEKAKLYYERVITAKDMQVRDEVMANAYTALARVLMTHGTDYQYNKNFFTTAVKKYPENATFWSYLAITHYQLKNQTEALIAAEKAKSLMPNSSTELLYNRIKNKEPLKLQK